MTTDGTKYVTVFLTCIMNTECLISFPDIEERRKMRSRLASWRLCQLPLRPIGVSFT